MIITQENITLDQAEKVIFYALAKSEEMSIKMAIAVVDAAANLVAFTRMDGAWGETLDTAIKKAKTARYFDQETGIIGGISPSFGSFLTMEHAEEDAITFPGGFVLKDQKGNVIGAIGVSGSSIANDDKIAEAGALAI